MSERNPACTSRRGARPRALRASTRMRSSGASMTKTTAPWRRARGRLHTLPGYQPAVDEVPERPRVLRAGRPALVVDGDAQNARDLLGRLLAARAETLR